MQLEVTPDLIEHLRQATGLELGDDAVPVIGGDINAAFRLHTADGKQWFLKLLRLILQERRTGVLLLRTQ